MLDIDSDYADYTDYSGGDDYSYDVVDSNESGAAVDSADTPPAAEAPAPDDLPSGEPPAADTPPDVLRSEKAGYQDDAFTRRDVTTEGSAMAALFKSNYGFAGTPQELVQYANFNQLTSAHDVAANRVVESPLLDTLHATPFTPQQVQDYVGRDAGFQALFQQGRDSADMLAANRVSEEARNCASITECEQIGNTLLGRAEILSKGADWAAAHGDTAAAAAYRNASVGDYYDGRTALDRGLDMSAASQAAAPRPSESFSLAPGWNTGEASAGFSHSAAPGLPEGSFGAGIYDGLGLEFEVGIKGGRVDELKFALGFGMGGYLKTSTPWSALGPEIGAKTDLGEPFCGTSAEPGDFRIGLGTSAGAGFGIGGGEVSAKSGLYSNANGNKGTFAECKVEFTTGPEITKPQGMVKAALEFAYRRQAPH